MKNDERQRKEQSVRTLMLRVLWYCQERYDRAVLSKELLGWMRRDGLLTAYAFRKAQRQLHEARQIHHSRNGYNWLLPPGNKRASRLGRWKPPA